MNPGKKEEAKSSPPLLTCPPIPAPQSPHLPGRCPLCSSQSLPGSGGKRRDLQCDLPAALAGPEPGERPPAACTMEEGQELVASALHLPEPPRPSPTVPGSVEGLRQRAKSQLSHVRLRANSYTWPRNHHITYAHTIWVRDRIIVDTHTHIGNPSSLAHAADLKEPPVPSTCSLPSLPTPLPPLPGPISKLCPPPQPQFS